MKSEQSKLFHIIRERVFDSEARSKMDAFEKHDQAGKKAFEALAKLQKRDEPHILQSCRNEIKALAAIGMVTPAPEAFDSLKAQLEDEIARLDAEIS